MVEILILSLTRGAVYALVAAGFVLVFSVGGVLNLAHGTLFMLGAYFTYIYFTFVFAGAGTPALLAAIALAVASVCVVALLFYFVLLRRKISSASYVMVMSLSVALFVEQILKVYFGTTSTGVPPLLRGSEEIFGTRILSKELLLLPVAFFTLAGLWLFLHRTRLGRAIEAVAQSRDGAILIGIDPDRALGLAIAISAGLAGLAGTLVAPLVTVSPSIWSYWLVKAFAIAILGGLGSLLGAVIAAFLLSFVEIATTFASSDQYSDLVALLVILAILLLRPSGLMGVRRA